MINFAFFVPKGTQKSKKYMDNFKYYMLGRKGDQVYPLLRIADRDYNEEGKITMVYLEINIPVPRKPILVDFLYASKDIVSKRIADVMLQFDMDGVQFIPTELTMPNGEIIEDHVCVVVDDNTYAPIWRKFSDSVTCAYFFYKFVTYSIHKIHT